MSPDKAAKVILRGVERGQARVLIGWDAYALDAFVRITGSGYQGIVARFSKSRRPLAPDEQRLGRSVLPAPVRATPGDR